MIQQRNLWAWTKSVCIIVWKPEEAVSHSVSSVIISLPQNMRKYSNDDLEDDNDDTRSMMMIT